jgi:PilZ domain
LGSVTVYNTTDKKPADAGVKKNSTTQTIDRRHAARYQFTASAEVIEHSTGARFSTRTTDLGPGGCFVDTLVPFPIGSNIRIALHKGKNTFETDASVVYAQTGLGMGIAFNDLNPQEAEGLRDWLKEVTKEREEVYEILRTAQPEARPMPQGLEKTMIVRLVRLLVTKGMLTEAEGSAVLFDPVL